MATYSATAINVGSFNLGEADKLLTLFSSEHGLIKAVAKGARKPGTKIAGRADLLNVNNLFLASGRSLDIITQAESIETFPALRQDLLRLSYSLYYAELTVHFGPGLSEESAHYFNYLRSALKLQAESAGNPAWQCLRFELGLLQMLGYKPELTYCLLCRQPFMDSLLGAFHQEWGGIICKNCLAGNKHMPDGEAFSLRTAREITPAVWRHLILASEAGQDGDPQSAQPTHLQQSLMQARRLVQAYIEHRAGRRMKALDLLASLA